MGMIWLLLVISPEYFNALSPSTLGDLYAQQQSATTHPVTQHEGQTKPWRDIYVTRQGDVDVYIWGIG